MGASGMGRVYGIDTSQFRIKSMAANGYDCRHARELGFCPAFGSKGVNNMSRIHIIRI